MPGDEERQRWVAAHPAEAPPEHGGRVGDDVGGHVVCTLSSRWPSLRPVRERNTSSRSAERIASASTSMAFASSRSSSARRECTPPSFGRSSARPWSSRVPLPSACGRPVERRLVGELEPDAAAGHEPLELGRRALGDDPAAVEQRDPAREPVGLLEVLRREQDRDAARDELADDVPHHPPAAGVEAGRRLVEEDDPRVADEGHRQVQPAAHAAGVGHRGLGGVVDEVEPLEQLGDLAPARAPCRGGGGRPSGAGSPRP